MLGRRVRHAGGAGVVTHMGNRGVTIDGVHKVEHGSYQLDDGGADLEDVAHGYGQFLDEAGHDLELGAGSRNAKLAAMAVVLDEEIAKQPTMPDAARHRVRALVEHLKAQPGSQLFVHARRGSDHTDALTGRDVDDYLGRWGLSRERIETYWVNRALVDHATTAGADTDLSGVDRLTGARGPRGHLDPRVVAAVRRGDASRATRVATGDPHERAEAFTDWLRELGANHDDHAPHVRPGDDRSPQAGPARPPEGGKPAELGSVQRPADRSQGGGRPDPVRQP